MKHFVAYHIRDKEGPFKGLHEGQTRFWDSAKGYKAETIEGSRLGRSRAAARQGATFYMAQVSSLACGQSAACSIG